eukprot:TRINITY_DN33201_c0_g1_i1.p1 TRINITY_DN33201_c0_g1~~TRINITY_DN33201_c0_g1_i1.p1  ORF type:complete len:126 (+),score=55.90 TRINITY_DN33201_c0_g1_i1:41-418(+)
MSSTLDALEALFQTDQLQAKLSEFMHKEAKVNVVFESTDLGEEQKLEYYEVWRAFCDMIEKLLESFLEDQPCSRDDLLRVLAEVPDSCDSLVCAPYILSVLKYEQFLDLVAQWRGSYDEEELGLA